jgi:hypothetical protein
MANFRREALDVNGDRGVVIHAAKVVPSPKGERGLAGQDLEALLHKLPVVCVKTRLRPTGERAISPASPKGSARP